MPVGDKWGAGSMYEDFMGRWSRRLATRFVDWLPVRPEAHWLDVGCGTGALTDAILAGATPASVVGCDPSETFVEFARRGNKDSRVSFVVAGVGSLPARAGGYDSVSSQLALNFFPELATAVGEMKGLCAANGMVSACVWDYGERMELLRYFWDAAVAVDENATQLDEGRRFSNCRPDALVLLFREAGLSEVVCEAVEVPTEYRSFGDLWQTFQGGTGPAPSYVASLDANDCETLAARFERSLPREANGEIRLVARAWVVRGEVH